jgi:hypothetical protein
MSKGEDKILKIFNKYKIRYDREITFPNLFGKKQTPLRFDFGIYSSDRRLVALIEFDGEQHFQYSSHFNKSKSDFLYRCGCDRKKNEWALKNNVLLYRVPFWELDSINTFSDLLQNKFKVTSIYHNDRLIREKFGGK